MKVDKIRKRHKLEWTQSYIFGDLSFWYLEKNHNQINKLEKILFLMQHESLTKYGVPLLVYKTYIYENGIYLRYLSDMLRISEPTAVNDQRHIDKKVKKYGYEEMMNKYAKYTERKLNDSIQELIQLNTLNKDYFVFEKYSNHKERKIVRMFSHFISFYLMVIFGMLLIAMFMCLIIDIFSYMGLTLRVYNSEETYQILFFGLISLIIVFFCGKYAIKKPVKYELENSFPFTTFCNETKEIDNQLPYNDAMVISSQMCSIDTNQIKTNLQIQNIEKQIFNDIYEMMLNCAQKYPHVDYVLTLERSRVLDIENEELPKWYSSTIYVYLTRNHVILERKKDEGEWPGASSEILKIKKNNVIVNEECKEVIREQMEWCSQVYLGDVESHFENKEESNHFLENSNLTKWIEE